MPAITTSPIVISEIAFVGYPITDVARARAFYEGVLGLKPSREFGGEGEHAAWIEYDIGPATLAIASMGADKWKPSSDGPSVALEVKNFDETIAHLRGAGVRFMLEPMDSPPCKLAVILDPDGNSVAIHHRKTTSAS